MADSTTASFHEDFQNPFADQILCPHCQGRAGILYLKSITRQAQQLTLYCRNEECDFVWVAYLTAERTIKPSNNPHPEVRLPITNNR